MNKYAISGKSSATEVESDPFNKRSDDEHDGIGFVEIPNIFATHVDSSVKRSNLVGFSAV